MNFQFKSTQFLLAHAGICVLLALPLLAMQAQMAPGDTPSRDTHGIVVANMNPSVKPGDDF